MRFKEDLLPVIRIVLLVLLTVLVGVAQNVFFMGLRFPVLLAAPWIVCVAMHESALTSLLLGALSGGIYDLVSPVHDGVFAFAFALLAFFACILAKYKFRHTLTGAMLLTFCFGFAVGLIHFVHAVPLGGAVARDLLTGTLFPMALIAAVIAPLCFFSLGGLQKILR